MGAFHYNIFVDEYFFYKYKDAINTSTMNPKYKMGHVTVCASSIIQSEVSDSTFYSWLEC